MEDISLKQVNELIENNRKHYTKDVLKVYSKKKRKKKIRNAKEFKEKNGFEYYECFNLDQSLALWILPRLIYFKDNIEGIPDRIYSQIDYIDEEDKEQQAKKQWELILSKIIYSFYLIAKVDYCSKPEEIEEGLDLFREFYSALWQ